MWLLDTKIEISVLWELHFAQILAGVGEKTINFPVFHKFEVRGWISSLKRVKRWIILDCNILIETS